jgi:hypothetical protein
MPKATRKNTTPAKRAAPDPIIKLIDAADEALSQYRLAECDLMAAQDHFQSSAEDLELAADPARADGSASIINAAPL